MTRMGLSTNLISMLTSAFALAAPPAFAAPLPEATGSFEVAAATVYAVVPGYGLGHFVAGDPDAGLRFLALDLGASIVWMVGPSLVALVEGSAMNSAPSPAANAVFAIGLLAQTGLKIWEVNSARALADH